MHILALIQPVCVRRANRPGAHQLLILQPSCHFPPFPAESKGHLQIVKYNEPPTGHVLEVVLGEEEDAVLQALDLPNVITAIDLEG